MDFKKQQIMLGEILRNHNLITYAQLDEALEVQPRTGQRLGEILIDLGYISEQDLLMSLSIQESMPYVDLQNIDVSNEAVSKVSASMAKVYKVMPLQYDQNILTIAMADPLNVNTLDDLRFMLGCEVKGVIGDTRDIMTLVSKYYGAEMESVESLLERISDSEHLLTEAEEAKDDLQDLESMVNDAPVVKLLNLILLQAVKDEASDIHFEPFDDSFRVRYRIDGMLFEMAPPPKHLSLAITSRIKVMANMDIAERRLPQDGRIGINIKKRPVDLRVSTLPTIFGESVVMRVLDRGATALDYRDLGMEKNIEEITRSIIYKPNGIILVTGPTGSGKTTTLYSMLKELNSEERKIITTEDPVEYDMDGIIQIAINPKIDLTFARCLRSILRQDPDVIMVGEIRDRETAQIAVQASLTGHLVLSTLHTNDAPTAVTRLIDMGIEPFLITSTLECVIAQRLVRKLCLFCREAYSPDPYILDSLELKPEEVGDKKFYRAKGCTKCNNTGYKGRIGIFEVFVLSDRLREMILDKRPSSEIRDVGVQEGMLLLRKDALNKIFDGTSSFDEVVRET
ncbi:type II secretion system ATPase GspE [PVC group bacterium]|nr:type II secretion system ATPase GspE [PVC group bacterium]